MHNIRVTKNEDDKWATELVRRVGRAIKAARGGKSAAWLSDRTAELGYRVSPTVIAKLDSGHRGSVLSVAELLVLAAALDVPPAALLFPDLPDGYVAVLPHCTMASDMAMQWLTFEGGVFTPFRALVGESWEGPAPMNPKAALVQTVRQRSDVMQQLIAAKSDDRFRSRAAALEGQLRRLNAKIHELGGTVSDTEDGDD